jgi:GT2 family glycosyltransferase
MNIDLSIIIINYNTTNCLLDCLKSIKNYFIGVNYEIIIVDNNSTDRKIEELSKIFPDIRLFLRKANDGFGAGCNFGANHAKGEILAFINPDTIFESIFANKLIDFLKHNKTIGACSPSFINADKSFGFTFNYFPDLWWELFEFFGKGYGFRIKKLEAMIKLNIENNNYFTVDWVTGACFFIKTEIFNKIEGFDEEFFLYYEDVDIQKRISDLGYKIILFPQYLVLHNSNSSMKSEKGYDIYLYNIYRSKLIYLKKHTNIFVSFFYQIFHSTGIIFRIILLYFRSRYKNIRRKKLHQYKTILNYYIFKKDSLKNLLNN